MHLARQAGHIPTEPTTLGEMIEKSLYFSMNWLFTAVFIKVL